MGRSGALPSPLIEAYEKGALGSPPTSVVGFNLFLYILHNDDDTPGNHYNLCLYAWGHLGDKTLTL